MATVYQINKGVNRSIEFRGIKAQYLYYLAAGMMIVLLSCAGALAAGVHPIAAVGAAVPIGYGLVVSVQRYSKRYGEHGLVKKVAQSRLPGFLTISSREVFIGVNVSHHETK